MPPATTAKTQIHRRVITLCTDFGLNDWFVGTMKGVIAGIAPEVDVIDITHAVAPGDVRGGAFALTAARRFFPRGTVHLAVVDPGVGSPRPAIAIRTHECFLLGPDNGVLSWALHGQVVQAVHRLANARYFLPQLSRTFHGRDVFAPVAAHLACGVELEALGPPVSNYVRLPWPEPRREAEKLHGEVVHIDRFGNAITNLDDSLLGGWSGEGVNVRIGKRALGPLRAYYQAVGAGHPLALISSTGFLEVAVNAGSAAAALQLNVGSPVVVERVRGALTQRGRPLRR